MSYPEGTCQVCGNADPCPVCKGLGAVPHADGDAVCGECNGDGHLAPGCAEHPVPTTEATEAEPVTCGLCGQAMPPGEESFRYHGYSGPCPPKEPSQERDA